MNWCQPHYDKLKDAARTRGLWEFVGNGSDDAAAAFQGKRFDPLLSSWMAINQYMLQSPGVRGRLLMCPCCILEVDGQPELVDKWINGATDDAVQQAIALGMVSRA